MVKDEVTLVVASCDKYRTAWYPYFELVRQNWTGHPGTIILNTETERYEHQGLNIMTFNASPGKTWSQRLLLCLQEVKTDFIIFSLEDFFLQEKVREVEIEACLERMKRDPDIACFRLKASNDPHLIRDDQDKFRIAGSDVPYRLDTQFALWRTRTLMSFIHERESPWEFEGKGTERIKNTDKKFYWYYDEEPEVVSDRLIVPYVIGHFTGYGIQWGKWLYNNQAMFERYGIMADFSELGVLSRKQVDFRMKTVYCENPTGIYRMLKVFVSTRLKIVHAMEIMKREGMASLIDMAIGRSGK